MGPGEPAPVRGEGEVADGAVDGADQLGHPAPVRGRLGLRVRRLLPRARERPGDLRVLLRHVEEQQPSVVRGDGQPLARRVRDQLQHPAQLPGGQPPQRAGAHRPGQMADLDGVLALRVRHVRDPSAGAEHLRQPHPYARGVGEGAGRAVPVGEPVQAPAYDDGARAARLVDRDAADVLGGGHLVRAPSGARAAQPDVEPARPGPRRQVLDDPQVARALVHHAAAVARRVPGVEGVVVGVAAQVGAVPGDGVEVADAFVVGEERDPAADEHGGVQMPAQVGQQPLAVQPEPARGAAPVALPGGGLVRRGAGEQERPALAVEVGGLDVGDRAPGQLAAGIAVGSDLVGPGEVREGLAVRGDGEDRGGAVGVRGRPAADPGVQAAPVGQLPPGTAVHRHEVDLGRRTPPAGVRDVAAVGGEAGMTGLGAVDGEPPGAAGTVQGSEPEVVLGHEAQLVAAEVGKAQITHPPHALPPTVARQLLGDRLRGADNRDPDHVRNRFVSLGVGVHWSCTKRCRS